jgi:hypothetical protein
MNRLQHSDNGFIRSIEISQKQIYAFCEGKLHDKFFYSELIKSACNGNDTCFRVEQIDSVAKGAKGKTGLLNFFNELSGRNMLRKTLPHKELSCIFFFDKDADCIVGGRITSDHAIYTELYDVESQIYYYGNLSRSLASAMSVAENEVPERYKDNRTWLEDKSLLWKGWLTLCVFSQKYRINCDCGYSLPSKINGGDLIQPTPANEFLRYKHLLRSKQTKADDVFEVQFNEIADVIDTLASTRSLSKIFKGKWISAILESEIRTLIKHDHADLNSLSKNVLTAGKLTLDFCAPWSKHFIKKITRIIPASATVADSKRLSA